MVLHHSHMLKSVSPALTTCTCAGSLPWGAAGGRPTAPDAIGASCSDINCIHAASAGSSLSLRSHAPGSSHRCGTRV